MVYNWKNCEYYCVFVPCVYNGEYILLQATEVEETIKRIQAHKGVMGVVIVNHEGLVDSFTFP